MTIADSMWHANQDLAIACLYTPFVQGLADGSLAKAKFAYYVGQDAFFLTGFARAYSIAAAKSADLSGFEVFHCLASGVLEELRLHRKYALEWGVDLQQIEPGAATRRYTDFLLATAWSQDIGMTAVAMAPCMRLYLFLGKELAKAGIPDHSYADWIRTYSSEGFTDLTLQLENLIERYANPIPTAYSSYRYAMLCECDFFQAAWDVENG
ncbi:MAG: TenA family protein [Oscillatoriales cyanobacterium C42_A2020_001]|nr:TenA family protein [Leptolyngbyaceae cyanobacterium C42_A2020_001]